MEYRSLTTGEIRTLESQGCYCSDWGSVWVKEPFMPERIRQVHFSGTVRLGAFSGDKTLPGGIKQPNGLYHCRIHNCTLDDEVYISQVGSIANYRVSRNVCIENCTAITVDGKTAFGNGVEIDILNEGGGRTLPIFDRLSSQIAYLVVLYRHKKKFVDIVRNWILEYARSQTSDIGRIEENVTITNCRNLTNIRVGPNAKISGAILLSNGTIHSCPEDPTCIGDGVIIKDFIMLSGSRVDNQAILTSCFVGQAVKIGRQFSAENSAFFANTELFHGEGCSLFAGPYTVSHHKSTLLIAGLFSFYNAGSGSNQSNHMYKLGPIHQGVLERGSKTGSFSYMLWPCRVGAFSVVLGKHYANFDTAIFPFSYIFESNGKSLLKPAGNFLTVGLLRDNEKWPARDRRKDPNRLDLLHFDILSPYSIRKALKGLAILQELDRTTPEAIDLVLQSGIYIKRSWLKSSIENYEVTIRLFIGNCLTMMLEKTDANTSFQEWKDRWFTSANPEISEWRDLAGMYISSPNAEALIQSVEEGTMTDISQLISELKKWYDLYEEEKFKWCAALIGKRQFTEPKELTKEQIKKALLEWKESRIYRDTMFLNDAKKEFEEKNWIGFGIDGGQREAIQDFEAVRGSYETNSTVKSLHSDLITAQEQVFRLIGQIDRMK